MQKPKNYGFFWFLILRLVEIRRKTPVRVIEKCPFCTFRHSGKHFLDHAFSGQKFRRLSLQLFTGLTQTCVHLLRTWTSPPHPNPTCCVTSNMNARTCVHLLRKWTSPPHPNPTCCVTSNMNARTCVHLLRTWTSPPHPNPTCCVTSNMNARTCVHVTWYKKLTYAHGLLWHVSPWTCLLLNMVIFQRHVSFRGVTKPQWYSTCNSCITTCLASRSQKKNNGYSTWNRYPISLWLCYFVKLSPHPFQKNNKQNHSRRCPSIPCYYRVLRWMSTLNITRRFDKTIISNHVP